MEQSLESFVSHLKDALRDVGLAVGDPIDAAYDEQVFGNGFAVFKLDPIIVHITRDRGRYELSLGPAKGLRRRLYTLNTVEIAMGWKSVEEALDEKDLFSLSEAIGRLKDRFEDLASAFSLPRRRRTVEGLRRAEKARAHALMRRFGSGGTA